jgi:hypothetical protein
VNSIIDYLTDRKIQIEGKTWMELGGGVPQGSVLGPTLWNILYDDVMKLEVLEGAELICYADDLAVSITAKSAEELLANTNAILHQVKIWMRRHALEVAPQKTVAILLSGSRRMNELKIHFDGTEISISREATYLGVVLDSRLNFTKHVGRTTEKALKTTRALSLILPNTRGPKQFKRRTLAMAVQSILLYASPIWVSEISNTQSAKLLAAQRPLALRVCCAYRTVSTEAALVVGGLIPVQLLARERGRLYGSRAALPEDNRRYTERERTMEEWQCNWDSAESGRWTHRLIKHIKPWIERQHGQLTFRMTQCLTGHGVFYAYLKRIGKVTTDQCIYCSEEDTAEHTIFWCPRWSAERDALKEELQLAEFPLPENMVATMLKSVMEWESFSRLFEAIMSQKESDERALK